MADTVIPDFKFPALPGPLPGRDATGQRPPQFTERVAQEQRRIQITAAARDSYIPVIYGGWERTGGLLYLARVYQQKLVVVILLCEGPVEEVGTVQMNDSDLPAGVTVTKYTGAQTTVNATLAAAIPGFNETFAGTAYLVCQVPPTESAGFPRFTALVRGRKVYDPRDGTQTLGTPSTYKWSDNPALILGDFLSNTSYGARRTVDWESVEDAADHCDELLGSPSEKRSQLTFTIAEKRDVSEWVDAIRAYVPCWTVDDGSIVSLVLDAARATDHTFDADSIDSDPAPRLRKRGVMDSPTVVQVSFTRTDVTPWAVGYAEADTGSTLRRTAKVAMPGIRRYSQARRFAIERLNHYALEDLEIEFSAFEDGLKVREGDVVEVTDDIGVTAKTFRVLECADRSNGRWTIRGREYDAAAYSDVVETTPTSPNTGLPDPRAVPAPTALTIEEVVYPESNIQSDGLQRGLIFQSRLQVSWAASEYPYPHVYKVQIFQSGTLVAEGNTTGTSYASPAVQQGQTYTVNVIARGGLGFESAALTGTALAQGKLLPPGDVPAITSALEIGGEVLLQWSPAVDIDVVRYEWRYAAVSGFTWDGATLVDRIDGLRARFLGLPVGTWRFAVKAIDSVGNYSANATTVDVTITTDADALLRENRFDTVTLTNMLELKPFESNGSTGWVRRWATSVSGDTWNSKMPDPVNSGGGSVFGYHSSATSKIVGVAWDLGQEYAGDFFMQKPYTAEGSAPTLEIETSTDNSTYTTTSGTSLKGSARYVRPVIRTATTETLIAYEPFRMSLASLARAESGTETSLSSGAKTITLANKYTQAARVNVTAVGTTAKISTIDNVVLSATGTNTFDVYVFDSSGVQVASDFYWTFEGL